jgi:hypothetical protein
MVAILTFSNKKIFFINNKLFFFIDIYLYRQLEGKKFYAGANLEKSQEHYRQYQGKKTSKSTL